MNRRSTDGYVQGLVQSWNGVDCEMWLERKVIGSYDYRRVSNGTDVVNTTASTGFYWNGTNAWHARLHHQLEHLRQRLRRDCLVSSRHVVAHRGAVLWRRDRERCRSQAGICGTPPGSLRHSAGRGNERGRAAGASRHLGGDAGEERPLVPGVRRTHRVRVTPLATWATRRGGGSWWDCPDG